MHREIFGKKFNAREKVLAAAYVVVIAAGLINIANGGMKQAVETFAPSTAGKVVVIDAGHGGWDPGMIGVSDTVEAEINLLITERLQQFLEIGGASVFITRADDTALASKKKQDLNARLDVAEEYNADIFVSIHQNEYETPNVKGAEVFYFTDSAESKRLAECIQGQFVDFLQQKRIAKANSNYFLLKKSPIVSVIVECGYLSNPGEERLLTTDEYREKVAWAIYVGIMNYFNGATTN